MIHSTIPTSLYSIILKVMKSCHSKFQRMMVELTTGALDDAQIIIHEIVFQK